MSFKNIVIPALLLVFALPGCEWLVGEEVGKQSTPPPPVDLPLPEVNYSVDMFSGCEELQSYASHRLQQQQVEYDKYKRWWDRQPTDRTDAVNGSPARSVSDVNSQEEGANESDMVVVDDKYIFIARAKTIEVIDRRRLRPVGVLRPEGVARPRIFERNGQLVVVGRVLNEGSADSSPHMSVYPWNHYSEETLVFIYSVQGHFPELVYSHKFEGELKSSRVLVGDHSKDDRLVVVTQEYYKGKDLVGMDPSATEVNGILCSQVAKQRVNDFDFSLTGIHSLSLKKPQVDRHSTGVLGSTDEVYMTKRNVYLIKNYWQWFSWDSRPLLRPTLITQIDLSEEGRFSSSVGMIEGKVYDRWNFKELQGGQYLAVAAADQGANSFSVLNANPSTQRMNLLAEIKNIAPRESIRAVRYIDDMAYVVTFRKTDPIFSIDLSDAEHPQIIGELKVPGFSTYLHPISNNRLVGVGYATDDQGPFSWAQGIQVSMFDVSDPGRVTAIDQQEFGHRNSSSDATFDHRALLYDENLELLALPIVERDDVGPLFSGARFFNVESGVEAVAEASHIEWIPMKCIVNHLQGQWWQSTMASFDINRVVRVDDRLLTVSRFGFKAHRLSNLESVSYQHEFQDNDLECESGSIWGKPN